MALSRIFVRGLLALALVVGVTAVAPARAVTYVGQWDPAFGSDFPDLGWRGEVSFFVPNACLALTGFVSNANACSGFDMKFLGAEVEFYKVSDPTNPAFQETLVFDSACVSPFRRGTRGWLSYGPIGHVPDSRSCPR